MTYSARSLVSQNDLMGLIMHTLFLNLSSQVALLAKYVAVTTSLLKGGMEFPNERHLLKEGHSLSKGCPTEREGHLMGFSLSSERVSLTFSAGGQLVFTREQNLCKIICKKNVSSRWSNQAGKPISQPVNLPDARSLMRHPQCV